MLNSLQAIVYRPKFQVYNLVTTRHIAIRERTRDVKFPYSGGSCFEREASPTPISSNRFIDTSIPAKTTRPVFNIFFNRLLRAPFGYHKPSRTAITEHQQFD